MDLRTLLVEHAAQGIGPHLYTALRQTVRSVALGRGYPTTYSPTGQWDEDAIGGLTHDWVARKLLPSGQIGHFLLTNTSLSGFRKGLELSFVQFLISQKKQTALDNLFARSAHLLEHDGRFRAFGVSVKKAARLWGLATWSDGVRPFEGSDADLIAASLRLPEVRIVYFRPNARKLSQVVSDRDLADLQAALLGDLGRLLSLAHFMVAFRYRFNLLEAREVSLDEPMGGEAEGKGLRMGETVAAREPVAADQLEIREAAHAVLRELSTRQQRVLHAYTEREATLVSVATQIGCSKSLVESDLKRALRLIAEEAGDQASAVAVYQEILETLSGRSE